MEAPETETSKGPQARKFKACLKIKSQMLNQLSHPGIPEFDSFRAAAMLTRHTVVGGVGLGWRIWNVDRP